MIEKSPQLTVLTYEKLRACGMNNFHVALLITDAVVYVY